LTIRRRFFDRRPEAELLGRLLQTLLNSLVLLATPAKICGRLRRLSF